MDRKKAILFFVRYPEPGRVKTRLAASLGFKKAAKIYRRLVEINLKILRALQPEGVEIFVVYEPVSRRQEIQEWLAGADHYLAQEGEDLGERLRHAFHEAFKQADLQACTIGSDTLELTAEHVRKSFQRLEEDDVVLGPAEDEGYYLIGLNVEHSELFKGIPWSTSTVLETTVTRAKEAGLSYSLLEPLEDWDELKAGERRKDPTLLERS